MQQQIKTYSKDKRLSLNNLYNSYLQLNPKSWIKQVIYTQKDNHYHLPIFVFKTKKTGPALYIISGVHGEEPAGVNAIAKNIQFLNQLTKKIPIVLIPLANPKGYRKNWRYPELKKYPKNESFRSVGDTEPYLPNLKDPDKPRQKQIISEAKALSEYIINISKTHPPVLLLDFHEDESKTGAYIYSQAKLGAKDPIAREIVDILKQRGFKFYKKSKTTFNQPITNGIVSDPHDNTIDELIASKKVFLNNKPLKGPSAKSVIVIETNTIGIPLKKRVDAHEEILKLSEKFYKIAGKI